MTAVLLTLGLGLGNALAAWEAAPGYYTPQKVVYHNDGAPPDNGAYFKRLLGNIRNHVEALGKDKVEIRVVNHGDGLILFQVAKDDRDLAGRIDALKSTGVRFLICNNTLTERKIDWRGLYGVNEEDIVPSGVAELARLQGMGFTYIHP
jgi:intracellular sulfur oxidation DsrE/DsrF family protein